MSFPFIAFLVEVSPYHWQLCEDVSVCWGYITPPEFMYLWCQFYYRHSLCVIWIINVLYLAILPLFFNILTYTNAASNNRLNKNANSAPAETWCCLFLYISLHSCVRAVSKSHSLLFYWGGGGRFTDEYLKSCTDTRETTCTVRHH